MASVQVRLFEGKVVLEGLRLHPPPGYGEQAPLSWRGLTVDLAPLSLLTGKIVVEQIRLEKAALAVVRSREGKLNVLELAPATTPGPTPAEEQGRAAPPEVPAVQVNAQARLVGLKLDTLGSLVPPATRTALGATGLDAAISLVMDADGIDLNAEALTDRGIDYNGLRIHGAPGALSIEPGPVFAGVFNRVSDGLINMGKSGLKSSVDIVEGGAHAVEELGVGSLKLGANLGKSLFETTVGVVTIDKEKVAAGVVGTTKGTVDLTMDSVKGSGQAAGGGLKSSAADLKGESRVRAWDADIPARYRETMRHAERVLAEMPYPPVAR